jgi:hypothetical protein
MRWPLDLQFRGNVGFGGARAVPGVDTQLAARLCCNWNASENQIGCRPTSRVFRELLARRWSFNRLKLAQSLTKPRKITQTELASRLSSCGEGHGEMR